MEAGSCRSRRRWTHRFSDQAVPRRRFLLWNEKKTRARLTMELQTWADLAFSSFSVAPLSDHLLQISHNNITAP